MFDVMIEPLEGKSSLCADGLFVGKIKNEEDAKRVALELVEEGFVKRAWVEECQHDD